MQLFISHSSKDTSWVELVCKHIEAQGVAAYLAEHDPQPGRVLTDKLQQAIKDSGAVVVILTENAAVSPIVRDEIGFALGQGKDIIPLVAPAVAADPRALGMLLGVEYILFDLDDPNESLLALATWVSKLVAQRHEEELALAQQELAHVQQALLQAQESNFALTALSLVLVGAIAAVLLSKQ